MEAQPEIDMSQVCPLCVWHEDDGSCSAPDDFHGMAKMGCEHFMAR